MAERLNYLQNKCIVFCFNKKKFFLLSYIYCSKLLYKIVHEKMFVNKYSVNTERLYIFNYVNTGQKYNPDVLLNNVFLFMLSDH